MFTSRTLTGNTIWEQLNPPFRMVDFSDSPAVVTVAHYLRLAWCFVPDETYGCDEVGIGRFMRETQAKRMAEDEVLAGGEKASEIKDEKEGEEEEEIEAAEVSNAVDLESEVPLAKTEILDKDEDEDEDEDESEIEDEPENVHNGNGEGVDETEPNSHQEEQTIAPKTAIISPQSENPTPNPDSTPEDDENYHPAWQKAILVFWNHVFWDVMQFLPQVGMGIGHFHAPSHSSLTIPFAASPSSSSSSSSAGEDKDAKQKPVLTHIFTTNTLLVPTYLAPGCTLRMTTSTSVGTSTSKEEELGKFDDSTNTECWWLRQGVPVSFYIDSPSSSPQNASQPAAVLAIGILCDAMHEEAVEAIEAEEIQQEILEAEMEVPVDGPVLEVH